MTVAKKDWYLEDMKVEKRRSRMELDILAGMMASTGTKVIITV